MYLQVVRQKVDKGLSLQEALKSINISHKQMEKASGENEKQEYPACQIIG